MYFAYFELQIWNNYIHYAWEINALFHWANWVDKFGNGLLFLKTGDLKASVLNKGQTLPGWTKIEIFENVNKAKENFDKN